MKTKYEKEELESFDSSDWASLAKRAKEAGLALKFTPTGVELVWATQSEAKN